MDFIGFHHMYFIGPHKYTKKAHRGVFSNQHSTSILATLICQAEKQCMPGQVQQKGRKQTP